ncbi:hypothetical protein RJ639_008175 [Escallonia herrerae]|uniref:Uncharacterized protein n=1 Tax=Escallonia herrerae TaxID=1293975 RepID=A0AA88VSY7_9ASTE|nr:hypothetical protein RJ639_008175 [Escallonia herrerae]
MDEKSIALDAVIKESVDLENPPLEEVFAHLKCSKQGLSYDEVQERVMEAAPLMAIGLAHGGNNHGSTNLLLLHTSPGITMTLLVSSSCYQFNHQLCFIEENNVGNVAAALMAWLAPKAKAALDARLTADVKV